MERLQRLQLFNSIKKQTQSYDYGDIENAIIKYFLEKSNIVNDISISDDALAIKNILEDSNTPFDLEAIVELFEMFLEQDNKDENGIVFTPQYIARFIISSLISNDDTIDTNTTIIDPSCGCGIFLITAAEMLLERTNLDIDSIINNNIYGLEIDPDNARRCKLALMLLSAKHGGDFLNIEPNIKCVDSLKTDWAAIFSINCFSYIIGNPPYVNPHDMNKKTADFLKKTFNTTKSGVFNIFYAFIEHAVKFLNKDGKLGYIVPNNFLTITAAVELRSFLKEGRYIDCLIDFGENMAFKPVRTYNCIIMLSPERNEQYRYQVLNKTDNIEACLDSINYNLSLTSDLDDNGWHLVDDVTRANIKKIENQFISIKTFIRTGIATLKDSVFMVENDTDGYYKIINDKRHYIEPDLVKPIYKIPDIKKCNNLQEVERYIIFPYSKADGKYTLISEEEFEQGYPKTYNALKSFRKELDDRDKGKGCPYGWYAYGRTQGLNKYGKKLLFPTFSNHPKFIYLDNEDALFCNGYAVFENEMISLDVLTKILNSKVMDYYVSNTSYSIEGGYFCYQKKYIENFSIPLLNEEQTNFILNNSGKKLDNYLWNMYDLK